MMYQNDSCVLTVRTFGRTNEKLIWAITAHKEFLFFCPNLFVFCLYFCCRRWRRGTSGDLQSEGASAWPAATKWACVPGFPPRQSSQESGSSGPGGQESGQTAEGHRRSIQRHSFTQTGEEPACAVYGWSVIRSAKLITNQTGETWQ